MSAAYALEPIPEESLTMTMTFLPWGDYRGVKVLFDFWEIQSAFSLVLSCALLFLMAVTNVWIQTRIRSLGKNALTVRPTGLSQMNPGHLRLLLSLLSSIHYGLGLLLMLAAMTFQPWIFLAIVAGHGYGSFLFSSESVHAPETYSDIECH